MLSSRETQKKLRQISELISRSLDSDGSRLTALVWQQIQALCHLNLSYCLIMTEARACN